MKNAHARDSEQRMPTLTYFFPILRGVLAKWDSEFLDCWDSEHRQDCLRGAQDPWYL